MSFHAGPVQSSSAESAENILAFCRHLGELCDVLSAPYDAEALEKAASGAGLLGTQCSILLQNVLFHWLREQVELSLPEDQSPQQSAESARRNVLESIQRQNSLNEFVNSLTDACLKADLTAEVPMKGKKNSLFFDLQGPLDLLGPDEVEGLLKALATSDVPIYALEALAGDVHLLEDLCFGPSWPQLCDGLGRLVCLEIASAHDDEALQQRHVDRGQDPEQRQQQQLRRQQLLLTILQELASSTAASSPPHAAELLDALTPYLSALALELPLSRCYTCSQTWMAPSLLTGAMEAYPFATGLVRVVHQLLNGLTAELHTLPLACAAIAARAVCELVRAGVTRGAPVAVSASSQPAEKWATITPAVATAQTLDRGGQPEPLVMFTALDLLAMMDPELRWWRRLCTATHASQVLATALTSSQLASALGVALAAWAEAVACACASAPPATRSSGASRGVLAANAWGSACSSPTHIVACTSLLGGLTSANNSSLWGCELSRTTGDAAGDRHRKAAARGSDEATAGHPSASQKVGGSELAPVPDQEEDCARLRITCMIGHLTSCFCALAETPGLLRPGAHAAAASDISGQKGSVFLHLAAQVLRTAASAGLLPLLAPDTTSSSVTSSKGCVTLAPLLQAVMRAATSTASATAASTSRGEGAGLSAVAETEVWLAAAATVLRSAWDYVVLDAPAEQLMIGPQSSPTAYEKRLAAAEPMCSLLRHIAGRVRGCAGGTTEETATGVLADHVRAAPAWTYEVIRCATVLSAASPAVDAALMELYGTVHAVLANRHHGAVAPGLSAGVPRHADANISALFSSQCPLPALPEGIVCRSEVHGSCSGEQGWISRQAESPMDSVEVLAATAVLSYCVASGSSAGAAKRLQLPLPEALQHPAILRCAATWLCNMYESADDPINCGVAPTSTPGRRSANFAAMALKRRAVGLAKFMAQSCNAGQRALLEAGFARRILDTVTAVLRSGAYDSPYLEPRPYADQLTAAATALADVLCWPGLLTSVSRALDGRWLDPGEGAASVLTQEVSDPLSQHRVEVLALLQELVTWLDPGYGQSGEVEERQRAGLPVPDAALVSLQCFTALVASDPEAAAALERDTNIRWYLQNLIGTLPDNLCAAQGTDYHTERARRDEPQSDMLLDLARGLLRAIDGAQG